MSRRRRLLLWAISLLALTLVATVTFLVTHVDTAKLKSDFGNRTTGELIRYSLRRLEGHNKLEAMLTGPLRYLQGRVERPVPNGKLPALSKGQQTRQLPGMRYTPLGQPIDDVAPQVPRPGNTIAADITAGSTEEIIRALSTATAGQTIRILPGRYRINSTLKTGFGGDKDHPITVGAEVPGQVILEFNTTEGFSVSKPFWIFENLHLRGVCKAQDDCEHAFHVFGKARSTVIRNNLMEDFNAHLKINGLEDDWPDFGLIQYNTITDTKPRETSRPVTPIDIVGANQWKVADNIISNFVKSGGNQISYGVFMKGAGQGGRIERNLVICTSHAVSQPGVRVGISFGGGTTGKSYCRDKVCDAEHTGGVAANNIVAHCNDFGIDINRSSNILVAHNTLINTAGIDVRRTPASARVYGNLLDGRTRERDGGRIKTDLNEVISMADYFSAPDALNLSWLKFVQNVPSIAAVPKDFCGASRPDGTLPGATAAAPLCLAQIKSP